MHAYTSEIFIYVYTLFVCMIVLVKVLDKNIINISNLKRKKTLSPQPKKKMQNVLKREIMYFDDKTCKLCSFGTVLCFRLFWIF